jgi:staphyloferrin B biosynthesis citrate synthase
VNRLQSRRRANQAAFGVHLSFLCPEMVEFFGYLGFDWLFLDAEHTPLNHHLGRDLIRAADGAGLGCIVRVPLIDASSIEGFLDAGAAGIIGPNVASAAQARQLTAAVKFAPDGTRGSASRTRAARYGVDLDVSDFCHEANQTTFAVALIESQAGIDQLEAIMAVPEICYIGIGANDLGLSLGVTLGSANPQVQRLVNAAQARIRAVGARELVVVPDAQQARAAAARGCALIAIPDTVLLAGSANAFLTEAGARQSL